MQTRLFRYILLIANLSTLKTCSNYIIHEALWNNVSYANIWKCLWEAWSVQASSNFCFTYYSFVKQYLPCKRMECWCSLSEASVFTHCNSLKLGRPLKRMEIFMDDFACVIFFKSTFQCFVKRMEMLLFLNILKVMLWYSFVKQCRPWKRIEMTRWLCLYRFVGNWIVCHVRSIEIALQ